MTHPLAVSMTLLVGCSFGLVGLADDPPTANDASSSHATSHDLDALLERLGGRDACFMIKRLGSDELTIVNEARAATRRPPCSTFKIPHALIALETGVITPLTTFEWDGSDQPIRSWARDHTLQSAMDNSVVWCFQRMAQGIGRERMTEWLTRFDYGNTNTTGDITRFWLDDDRLGMSPRDQIAFMEKLYTDGASGEAGLPCSPTHIATVRDLIVLDRRDAYVFSGKTGSGYTDGRWVLGWFVGHLRRGDDAYVFVVRLEREDDASGRRAKAIAIELLQTMGLIETND